MRERTGLPGAPGQAELLRGTRPQSPEVAGAASLLVRIRRLLGVSPQKENGSSRWSASLVSVGAVLCLAASSCLSVLGAEPLRPATTLGAQPQKQPPETRDTNRAEKGPQAPAARLFIEMEDGSRIGGVPELEVLTVQWGSIGEIKVPLERISSIEFNDDDKTAKLTFRNEDFLQGSLDLTQLGLDTSFGKLSIPMAQVVRITRRQPETVNAVRNPNNGHAYAFIGKELAWEEARVHAEGLFVRGVRGHLATLTSAEENRWVQESLGLGSARYVWIGGFQRGGPEPAGGWEWITSEQWRWTNWRQSEPNDNGGEHHLEFWHHHGGCWNDNAAVKLRPSMVEFEPHVLKDGGSCLVETDDGSRIVGTPELKTLKVDRRRARKLEVPLARVSSIEFGNDDKTAKVTLSNEDVLHGTLDLAQFHLETSLGRISVPIEDVSFIAIR